MKCQFGVPLSILKAAILFTDRTASWQQPMQSVQFTTFRDKRVIAATDGHALFVMELPGTPDDEGEWPASLLVPYGILEEAMKGANKRFDLWFQQNDEGKWNIMRPGALFPFTPPDCVFPEWQRIYEDGTNGRGVQEMWALGGDELARIAKAAKELGGGSVVIRSGPRQPHEIVIGNQKTGTNQARELVIGSGPFARVLQMPLNVKGLDPFGLAELGPDPLEQQLDEAVGH